MREIIFILTEVFFIFLIAVYVYIEFNIDYNCLFFVTINRVIKLRFNKEANTVTLIKGDIVIDKNIKFSFGSFMWWYMISNKGFYVVNRLTSNYKIYEDIANLPSKKLKKLLEKKSVYPWNIYIEK